MGSFANISNIQILNGATGGYLNSPLGTLSSTVQLNRGAVVAGVTPVDNGNGTLSMDLSSYSGFSIQVTIYSTLEDAYPYQYADAIVDPLPIENLTDFGDALRGKRCQRTGLWCPASRLKHVKGIPFLDTVAPDMITQYIPNPPFIQQVSSLTGNTPQTGPYNQPVTND